MDTSFSGISNAINGNEVKGHKIIKELHRQYVDEQEAINQFERDLLQARNKKSIAFRGIVNVFKALKVERPEIIVMENEILILGKDDIKSKGGYFLDV